MKNLIVLCLSLLSIHARGDVKISQLPLGTAGATVAGDVFPFVNSTIGATQKMTLWGLINLPPMVSTYAPLASPSFTGAVTTPSLIVSGQTATTVPYFDGTKHLVSSAATPTQLGYLANSTSNLCGINQSCTLTNKTLTSPTLVTPALGTPSSGTLTSCTGLPISTGVSGLGANIATWLATPSATNLNSAVTNTTGSSGSALVFAGGPAFSGTTTFPGSTVIDSSGNVGIGGTPTNTLDINGTLRIRVTSTGSLVNGANNNVTKPATSNWRVSGPSGAFSITGITAGQDGEVLYIYNVTGNSMTVANTSGSSSAANQIQTNTGADITTTGPGVVMLVYSTSDSKWNVYGFQS